MLSYVTCKIHSDTLSFGGVTIFKVKSVNIIPGLPYREGGLAMTSVDPVGHHDNRVCEEDGLEHAQAVASTLVAQLVEEEDQPKETLIPNHHIVGMEQCFYR